MKGSLVVLSPNVYIETMVAVGEDLYQEFRADLYSAVRNAVRNMMFRTAFRTGRPKLHNVRSKTIASVLGVTRWFRMRLKS